MNEDENKACKLHLKSGGVKAFLIVDPNDQDNISLLLNVGDIMTEKAGDVLHIGNAIYKRLTDKK